MHWVGELHNRYRGRAIWIAGSDPTLEEYPDNFFDDKLSITLHLAFIKFPRATYRYFNERDRLVFLKENYPEILDMENIYAYPFYRRTIEESEEATEGTERGHYVNLKHYPPDGNSADIFNDKGPAAMRTMVKDALYATNLTFGDHGTCLHACMYVAIMMGCNPINIIGCGFGAVSGKEHFGTANEIDKGMRPSTPSFTGYRGDRMTRGLEAIVAGCKDNGIVVNRFNAYK